MADGRQKYPSRVHLCRQSEAPRVGGAESSSSCRGGSSRVLGGPNSVRRRGFRANALNYESTWPEAWTRMCSALNLMARVDEYPGIMCSFEKFNERPQRGPVLPYIMLGRNKVKRAATSEPKRNAALILSAATTTPRSARRSCCRHEASRATCPMRRGDIAARR